MRAYIIVTITWPELALEELLNPWLMVSIQIPRLESRVGIHPEAFPETLGDTDPQPGSHGNRGVGELLKPKAKHRDGAKDSIRAADRIRARHPVKNSFLCTHATFS